MALLLHSIFVGEPKTISDSAGSWSSSIFRQPVNEQIEVGPGGLAGDRVADTVHHGRPGQAVCVHPIEHYAFWNQHYNLQTTDHQLGPGSVGENWTLEGANEKSVCIGDIYRVGSARMQVSGPRGPCWKQERKLKLQGFLKETLASLRTGFYLRVLTPGSVRPGDEWHLESRPNPWLTAEFMNICYYRKPDQQAVERILATAEVADEWKAMFRRTEKR